MDALTGLPDGVTLNALSREVYLVLQKYTVFPWPVLSTQCKRLAIDPVNITIDDLGRLITPLAVGVARFTSPAHETTVRNKLTAVLTAARGNK